MTPKPRIIKKGSDARRSMFEGIKELASVVKATLGPRGRNFIIERPLGMPPTISNDGITVAREVFLSDPFGNMGANLVKAVAAKANEDAGDGTTTATLLAEQIIEVGMKVVDKGEINPMLLKKGMRIAQDEIVSQLDKMSRPINTTEEMRQVATISSQNEEVGDIIGTVFDKVGAEGVVQVEDGGSRGFDIEMKEGYNFNTGLLSPFFMNDGIRMEGVYEDFYVLVTDYNIKAPTDLVPLLNSMAQAKQPHIIIIAPEITGTALATLVINCQKGTFQCIGIKAPEFGDRQKAMLQDIAAFTGATYISKDTGRELQKTTMEDLGRARRVISKFDETTIIEGAGKEEIVQARIDLIKKQIEDCKVDFERERLEERLSKLTGKIAVIKVGAGSEVELKEMKHRIEDAIHATKAAHERGILPGGGLALYRCLPENPSMSAEEKMGYEIIYNAIKAPIRQIIENAGENPSKILPRIDKAALFEGYDATSPIGAPVLKDMFEAGIVDPTKVTVAALENAVSVASMFLTTETALTNDPNYDEKN